MTVLARCSRVIGSAQIAELPSPNFRSSRIQAAPTVSNVAIVIASFERVAVAGTIAAVTVHRTATDATRSEKHKHPVSTGCF